MKKHLLSIFSLCALGSFGQGFPSSNINWTLPDGGRISGGTFYGFNRPQNTGFSSENTGSQTWFLRDMNGDKAPDLVVAAQIQDGNLTCFSPGLNQYWKVYLNTGGGFSTSPLNWNLPNGGLVRNGIIYGFDNQSGSASTFDNTGSQNWSLTDMNGDNKPDLVVTGQLQGGQVTCFSPGAGAYWKVYLNNGTGFSTTHLNWNLPNGGRLSGGIAYGYHQTAGTAFSSENTGSQSWALTDMDGDNKPDLVVTAQIQAGIVSCFSPGSGQYWKVYFNTSNSFNTSASNWNLPNGGKLNGGITYGYDAISGIAFTSNNTGSQSWAVTDIDGDKKPDLIVTAQLQAGQVTCFSPGSNQYWKVFTNNNTEFSATPVNWSLPNGGTISGGITYGFPTIAGTAFSSDNTGSQSWALIDLDGYAEPELVITAQLQAGQVTCFSPGNNQYWKVFKNTKTGFSTSVINCTLPVGGKLAGGVTYGFNSIGDIAQNSDNTGSQSWSVLDMDADNIADLVISGQLQAGNVTSFSPTSSQYWKVYRSDFVTGIAEHTTNTTSFGVFPNPNNGSFTISGSAKENLIISNEMGQVIKTLELDAFNNFSSQINDLPDGVYFVSGKHHCSKLIVIQ